MIEEKPHNDNTTITRFLKETYDIDASTVLLLNLGADLNTTVYRITTSKDKDYFLKLRRGDFCEASVLLPHHLHESGCKNIIPALRNKFGNLWSDFAPSFKAILYPYIENKCAADSKLSKDQWVQLGRIIKKLHSTNISGTITLPHETFSLRTSTQLGALLQSLQNEDFKDPIQEQTADFLKDKNDEILKLIECAHDHASRLHKESLNHIVCHADLHGWNIIIDQKNELYLIDWDTLILAPIERDLMFIGAGIWDSSHTPEQEEAFFYQGYGPTEMNHDAFCYYRFTRIINDIFEYAEHIFKSNDDDCERMQSFEYLKANFLASGTIERAYQKT